MCRTHRAEIATAPSFTDCVRQTRRWGWSASAATCSSIEQGLACRIHLAPRTQPYRTGQSRADLSPAGQRGIEVPARVRVAHPRWLGGELGITMVLHTWGQNLGQHIHVHCIVTDGALSPDRFRALDSRPVRRDSSSPQPPSRRSSVARYLEFLTAAHRFGELRMPGDDGLDDTCARFECLKTSLQSNGLGVSTAKLRWPESSQRSRLPRALHPQDRHRQSSTRRLRWRACTLPMARLRSRQQAQGDAPRREASSSAASCLHCAPAPIHGGCATTACSPIEERARKLALCRTTARPADCRTARGRKRRRR